MSALAVEGTSIQRIGEVPIYQADPIVRRAESLAAHTRCGRAGGMDAGAS